MTRFKAIHPSRLALFALLFLLVLAGCDATALPGGATPQAATTSTPKIVAGASTPTLPEVVPNDTATPDVIGGTQRTATAKPPRPTGTPKPAQQATETPIEAATEAPTKVPPTAVANTEPSPTVIDQADRVRIFEQVWDTVDQNYLYPDFHGADWDALKDKYEPIVRDAGTSDAFYGAISDMVAELKDDHSRYLSPEGRVDEDALDSGNTNYFGVGVISGPADSSVLVSFVYPNSPAERAGIKRRDRITAVDGQPITDTAQVPQRVRGPEGTTVVLTVKSPQQPVRDVPIVRGRITGSIAPSASRLENEPSIGYLVIPSLFVDNMGNQVDDALTNLLNGTPKLTGLVIDLRDNGGGFRTVLQQVLGDFVSGQIGAFFDQKGDYPFTITAQPLFSRLKNIPLVMLVDSGTQSYGEVLTAALQEKKRAEVVGVHSAGNTETAFEYNFDDGSRLWCAQEGFKLLDGTNMEGRGVIPDYVIDQDWTTFSEKNDPHILKAIDLITLK